MFMPRSRKWTTNKINWRFPYLVRRPRSWLPPSPNTCNHFIVHGWRTVDVKKERTSHKIRKHNQILKIKFQRSGAMQYTLYYGFFFKKKYSLYQETEGVSFICTLGYAG
jgi:hypothetical protein